MKVEHEANPMLLPTGIPCSKHPQSQSQPQNTLVGVSACACAAPLASGVIGGDEPDDHRINGNEDQGNISCGDDLLQGRHVAAVWQVLSDNKLQGESTTHRQTRGAWHSGHGYQSRGASTSLCT